MTSTLSSLWKTNMYFPTLSDFGHLVCRSRFVQTVPEQAAQQDKALTKLWSAGTCQEKRLLCITWLWRTKGCSKCVSGSVLLRGWEENVACLPCWSAEMWITVTTILFSFTVTHPTGYKPLGVRTLDIYLTGDKKKTLKKYTFLLEYWSIQMYILWFQSFDWTKGVPWVLI